MSESTILSQVENDVPLHAIRIDGGTQPRTEIHEATVAEYAEAMRQGVNLPPLILFFDGAELWLADGFHRYHACMKLGLVATGAEIHNGTRRDAVLYAVGANATHGLQRSNADKRRAITMLLEDPEWAQWSDNQIAKACAVSPTTVGTVRSSLSKLDSEEPAERTYTTKHGTTATMRTNRIGKSKPVAVLKPSNSTELKPASENQDSPANLISSDPAQDTGAPAPIPPNSGELNPENPGSPANGIAPAAAVARLTELQAENATLRAQVADLQAEVADLKHDVAELLEENEEMGRVFEADNQVKAALAEAARHKALAENAERTLAARSNEFNERARNVTYWKNRAEKAEKMLGKVA
jgi:regulator of replication initiation timing